MSKSRRLSSASGASGPLELQWRPSRQVAAALGALAALAPYSLLACELPLGWRLPLALLAGVAGVRTVRRYLAEPPMTLAMPIISRPPRIASTATAAISIPITRLMILAPVLPM